MRTWWPARWRDGDPAPHGAADAEPGLRRVSEGHRVTNAEVIALSAAHEVGVYARQPVAFVRGRGAELWDADGKRYLDFFAGLAVNNLGHCHPAVVAAVRAQGARLVHGANV